MRILSLLNLTLEQTLIFQKKMQEELDRLCTKGVVSPVKTSKLAILIVPMVKKDGAIRICGDFKSTVNQTLIAEPCLLPRFDEEIFSNLPEEKYFTKLNMSVHIYTSTN